VIANALKPFEIEIESILKPEFATTSKANPQNEAAFVCWLGEHWFTVRKIGDVWWNLDSMLKAPNQVSDTYLGMLLDEMVQQKYTVFVVKGELPQVNGMS
jgi:ataxin-3